MAGTHVENKIKSKHTHTHTHTTITVQDRHTKRCHVEQNYTTAHKKRYTTKCLMWYNIITTCISATLKVTSLFTPRWNAVFIHGDMPEFWTTLLTGIISKEAHNRHSPRPSTALQVPIAAWTIINFHLHTWIVFTHSAVQGTISELVYKYIDYHETKCTTVNFAYSLIQAWKIKCTAFPHASTQAKFYYISLYFIVQEKEEASKLSRIFKVSRHIPPIVILERHNVLHETKHGHYSSIYTPLH